MRKRLRCWIRWLRGAADIAVIQECAKPSVESENCLWFGDNPKQGILVLARSPYRLRALPVIDGVPKFVIPVAVEGPTTFTLFAVWTKAGQRYRYVRGAVKAVELYRELFLGSACVLMGDFNSSTQWDLLHPTAMNHSALVTVLRSLGLVSAYHYLHEEAQGSETRPTHYYRWQESNPFHIDYCFIPADWETSVTDVTVGNFESWRTASDHRPLTVHIRL